MGCILSSKRNNENNKVIIEIEVDQEELVQLKGEMDNVHLFSEKVADLKTNISSRGKNSATKYFLIPRTLRRDLNIREPISCQRTDTPQKAIFVYVVHKDIFQRTKKVKTQRIPRKEVLPEMPLDN